MIDSLDPKGVGEDESRVSLRDNYKRVSCLAELDEFSWTLAIRDLTDSRIAFRR